MLLWARGDGLEIVLLISGAVLVVRFVHWAARRYLDSVEAGVAPTELQSNERLKHRHVGVEAAQWLITVFVCAVVGVASLDRLGIPVTGLVAPATVLGVALGFGAQRVVQDLLSGFFVIVERQYGFGDQITASTSTGAVSGTVEDVTMRTTRVRTINGELLIIPNGEIRQVTNRSREWARAIVDVPVPTTEDVSEATSVLRAVADDAMGVDDLASLLLDPPSVMGVERLDPGYFTLRLVARTLPGRQFEVARLLRQRIAMALHAQGIEMGTTTMVAAG